MVHALQLPASENIATARLHLFNFPVRASFRRTGTFRTSFFCRAPIHSMTDIHFNLLMKSVDVRPQ